MSYNVEKESGDENISIDLKSLTMNISVDWLELLIRTS